MKLNCEMQYFQTSIFTTNGKSRNRDNWIRGHGKAVWKGIQKSRLEKVDY